MPRDIPSAVLVRKLAAGGSAPITAKTPDATSDVPKQHKAAEFTALIQVRDQDGIAGLQKLDVIGLIYTPTQPHRPPELIIRNSETPVPLTGYSADRVNAAIGLMRDGSVDLTPKGLQSPAIDRFLQPPVRTFPGVESAIQRGRHALATKPGSFKNNTPWLG